MIYLRCGILRHRAAGCLVRVLPRPRGRRPGDLPARRAEVGARSRRGPPLPHARAALRARADRRGRRRRAPGALGEPGRRPQARLGQPGQPAPQRGARRRATSTGSRARAATRTTSRSASTRARTRRAAAAWSRSSRSTTLERQPDGTFSVVLSRARARGREANWIRIDPDTTSMMLRQIFWDRAHETPAALRLERIDAAPALPRRSTPRS